MRDSILVELLRVDFGITIGASCSIPLTDSNPTIAYPLPMTHTMLGLRLAVPYVIDSIHVDSV